MLDSSAQTHLLQDAKNLPALEFIKLFPSEGLSLEELGQKFLDVIRSTTAPEDQQEYINGSHYTPLLHRHF